MERQAVQSSAINSIGYDKITHDLEIQFKEGAIEVYHDVPSYTYGGLISAMSIGYYFNTYIRNNYSND